MKALPCNTVHTNWSYNTGLPPLPVFGTDAFCMYSYIKVMKQHMVSVKKIQLTKWYLLISLSWQMYIVNRWKQQGPYFFNIHIISYTSNNNYICMSSLVSKWQQRPLIAISLQMFTNATTGSLVGTVTLYQPVVNNTIPWNCDARNEFTLVCIEFTIVWNSWENMPDVSYDLDTSDIMKQSVRYI